MKKNTMKGFSLIELSLFVAAVGIMQVGGITAYKTYRVYKAEETTKQHLARIDAALQKFYRENKRLPAPAHTTIGIDDSFYGKDSCSLSGTCPGTYRVGPALGPGKRIRTGAVPTRTLGLEDEIMNDGYGNRLMYAMTEAYSTPNQKAPEGLIRIKDRNDATGQKNNDVLDDNKKAAYVIFSPGQDDRVAVDMNGKRKGSCDASVNNCFTQNPNGVFVADMAKDKRQALASGSGGGGGGGGGANRGFSSNMVFWAPTTTQETCAGRYGNIIVLMDTSQSMFEGNFAGTNKKRKTVAKRAVKDFLNGVVDDKKIANEYGSKLNRVGFSNFDFQNSGPSDDVFKHLTYTNKEDGNNPKILTNAELNNGYDGYFLKNGEYKDYQNNKDGGYPDGFAKKIQHRVDSVFDTEPKKWGTLLFKSLERTISQINEGEKGRPNVIIVISDGRDVGSTIPGTDKPYKMEDLMNGYTNNKKVKGKNYYPGANHSFEGLKSYDNVMLKYVYVGKQRKEDTKDYKKMFNNHNNKKVQVTGLGWLEQVETRAPESGLRWDLLNCP